jgi:hypothetical protein
MHILSRKNILFVTLFVFFTVPVFFAYAVEPYNLLVKDLPGIGASVTPGGGASGGMARYLNNIFKIGLGIAVTLAILMFVYNGVIYMMSDIVGKKEEAKGAFLSILGGLVLVFGSVVVLNTINPQLINFGLFDTLNAITPPAGSTGGTGVTPPGGATRSGVTDPAQETAARQTLNSNVRVNQNQCTAGQGAPNCINIGDLPAGTLGKINTLSGPPCNCQILITGGTELGHSTHDPNSPMVDFNRSRDPNDALNAYLEGLRYVKTVGGGKVYTDGTSEFWDEPAKPGTNHGRHWHACIGTQCRFN